jgi:plastocyanin
MPAGPAAVEIVDFAFTPTPLVVRPGGTVTWTNDDDAAHSISDTSPLRTATSKPLSKGEQFSITYSKAGTYPYVCGIHNYMQGSVEVKN